MRQIEKPGLFIEDRGRETGAWRGEVPSPDDEREGF